MTTLSSKIINVHKKKMAQIAVDAVMAVANLDRNDVNFDMIKVRSTLLYTISFWPCSYPSWRFVCLQARKHTSGLSGSTGG